jgi:hypothetical protein
MSTVTRSAWNRYLVKLRNLSSKASDELIKFIQNGHDPYADPSVTKEVIDYAYALATKYGEGAGALASEMYDALAELSGKVLPPAVPAPTAKYGEVAKAVYGTKLQSSDPNVMANAIGRMVKLAGVDTMQQNALRDGAEWAWIPSGDTCAFCLTLASRGWQRASKEAIKNGHAEHVHANCDCTYAIRFSSDVDVEGYDPEALKTMYNEAEGATPNDKINYLRRQFYAENKGLVGAESSKAEEFIPFKVGKAVQDFEKKSRNLANERAIITFPDGRVYSQSQGRGRRVSVQEPPEAGFIFSHNHPAPVTFSVEDVRGFERAGYKQIRAASSEKTYILEALNPKRLAEDDRRFTKAMGDYWELLDDESARKRRVLKEDIHDVLKWRNEAESKWLKDNAPKYGYRYIEEPTK